MRTMGSLSGRIVLLMYCSIYFFEIKQSKVNDDHYKCMHFCSVGFDGFFHCCSLLFFIIIIILSLKCFILKCHIFLCVCVATHAGKYKTKFTLAGWGIFPHSSEKCWPCYFFPLMFLFFILFLAWICFGFFIWWKRLLFAGPWTVHTRESLLPRTTLRRC